jgi:hypothetical protein
MEDKMKHLTFLFLAVFIVALLATDCGKDGQPGNSYVDYDWYGLPAWITDDNPDTPPTIWRAEPYQTHAGTYNFSYEAWDGSLWAGSYEIIINPGEQGRVGEDGADGLDRYLTVWLLSNGPDIEVVEMAAFKQEMHLIEEAGVDLSEDLKIGGPPPGLNLILDDEIIVKESTKGNVTVHMEYRRAYVK